MTTHPDRAELRGRAHACLARAAGQSGRAGLDIKLDTLESADGHILPCNAATLFDVQWQVRADGHLEFQFFIDGVPFYGGRA